jgi:hypothetical protein
LRCIGMGSYQITDASERIACLTLLDNYARVE